MASFFDPWAMFSLQPLVRRKANPTIDIAMVLKTVNLYGDLS